jgi:hypothetical protein
VERIAEAHQTRHARLVGKRGEGWLPRHPERELIANVDRLGYKMNTGES